MTDSPILSNPCRGKRQIQKTPTPILIKNIIKIQMPSKNICLFFITKGM